MSAEPNTADQCVHRFDRDDCVQCGPWATWGGINAEIASIENACKQCGTVLAFEGDECGLCNEEPRS